MLVHLIPNSVFEIKIGHKIKLTVLCFFIIFEVKLQVPLPNFMNCVIREGEYSTVTDISPSSRKPKQNNPLSVINYYWWGLGGLMSILRTLASYGQICSWVASLHFHDY